MARVTGVPTLHFIAKRMCKYLTKYSVLIAQLYPSNTALIAALAAASAACATLNQELASVREYGD